MRHGPVLCQISIRTCWDEAIAPLRLVWWVWSIVQIRRCHRLALLIRRPQPQGRSGKQPAGPWIVLLHGGDIGQLADSWRATRPPYSGIIALRSWSPADFRAPDLLFRSEHVHGIHLHRANHCRHCGKQPRCHNHYRGQCNHAPIGRANLV